MGGRRSPHRALGPHRVGDGIRGGLFRAVLFLVLSEEAGLRDLSDPSEPELLEFPVWERRCGSENRASLGSVMWCNVCE